MNQKGRGILAYVFGWIAGLIVLFALNDNTRKTKIHAAQAITISAGGVVINMIAGFIPVLGALVIFGVGILSTVLWIMGVVKVCKDEDPKLPIIGDLTMKLFASQIGEEEADVITENVETAQDPISENQENN